MISGDEFGVLVSHFGEKMSTVIFFKNQIPVATRYYNSLIIRAGTIQSVSVQYWYRHQPIRIDTAIMLYRYRWYWQLQKTKNIPDPKLFILHLIFIQFNKKLKHIEFDLNYVELIICGKNQSLCFRTSICRIHCKNQSKLFTLFLKSNILDFETLNSVHTCVSYRIRIVSARSVSNTYRYSWWRIVPALLIMVTNSIFFKKEESSIRYSFFFF